MRTVDPPSAKREENRPVASNGIRRRVALVLLRITPPGLYHRVRRTPVLGRLTLWLLDRSLGGRQTLVSEVLSGPLESAIFELDPRVQADLLLGRYERSVLEAIVSALQRGDTAFDVGSHLGYFALVMALTVGEGGRVVCFEPDPAAIAGLHRNVERNSERIRASIEIEAVAVGAQMGLARFAPGAQTTRGRISDEGDLNVQLTTLDETVQWYGRPRLVKIDVEGGEVEVLRGAQGLLAEKMTTFVIEAHSDTLAVQASGLLETAGYGVERHREPGRAEIYLVARPGS
jgi:FkbM family methyltransferase